MTEHWGSKGRALGVFLLIVFIGPLIGLSLAVFGLVLAPPLTPLTSLIYLPIACLGLPIAILAVWLGWIRVRTLLLALILAGVVALFYLALLGPWLPGGMTNCQSISSALPQVQYSCVSTSSDDASYRYEFKLEGRAGWPVMRLLRPDPEANE